MAPAGVMAPAGAMALEPDKRDSRFNCAGQRLRLRADASLHWPRAGLLIVADPYLGAESAAPGETLPPALARLERAVVETGCARLTLVGAVLAADQALDALLRWRQRHPRLVVTIVSDQAPAHEGPDPRLDWQPGVVPLRPFCLHPRPPDHDATASGGGGGGHYAGGGYILAAGAHPVVALRGPHGRLRAPAFCFAGDYALLPAFGAAPDCRLLRPRLGQRLYAATPGGVLDVSAG